MAAHMPLKLVSHSGDPGSAEPAMKVLLSAKLVTTTDEIEIKVRELSRTGATLQAQRLPSKGCDFVLRRGTFEVFATITWARDGMCGVEFDTPLLTLEELLHAPKNRLSETPEAIGGPCKGHAVGPTRQDLDAARAWAFPTGRQAYLD